MSITSQLTKLKVKGLSRNVLLLGLTSFLNDMSTEMVYPLLPLFLKTKLGAPPEVIGLIDASLQV